jgi:hypothetical protein
LIACDYCLVFIKKRYGAPIVEDRGELISITHKEYREAFRQRLPLFTFVDYRTWNARNTYKHGRQQGFVPAKHLRVFDLIDEIQKQPRSNWMYFYKTRADLKAVIEQVLFNFDDSAFVGDVTVPDGTIVQVEKEFEKVWEIRNAGCVVWEDRYLREENTGASGLIPISRQIPIPIALPGETVRLAVRFKAPKYPCTCESYWKMLDSNGRYCLPDLKGLFCRVKVVY